MKLELQDVLQQKLWFGKQGMFTEGRFLFFNKNNILDENWQVWMPDY